MTASLTRSASFTITEARHIGGRVPARSAATLGIEQAFLLVKAQRARGHVELFRDLADRKLNIRGRGLSHGGECMRLDVNVNVNLVTSMRPPQPCLIDALTAPHSSIDLAVN